MANFLNIDAKSDIPAAVAALRASAKKAKEMPNRYIRQIGQHVTTLSKVAITGGFGSEVRAIKTGLTRASIIPSFQNAGVIIAPHTFYAVFVHEGTRRMAARPFLDVALAKAQPMFQEIERQLGEEIVRTVVS